jgi:segregation and condensation protein A
MEKPFWLNPPFSILFDLLRINKLKPWQIKLIEILNDFLNKMKELGEIDFPASGIALLSSSIIHRMKSESILEMEDPPKPPHAKPEEPNLPPLPPPLIKFEYAPISISEILKALEKALEKEKKIFLVKNEALSTPAVTEQLDDFLLNIKDYINKFYFALASKAENGKPIYFTELIQGQSLLQIIRCFLMLLFLANEGKIIIAQEEEKKDIKISLV